MTEQSYGWALLFWMVGTGFAYAILTGNYNHMRSFVGGWIVSLLIFAVLLLLGDWIIVHVRIV